VLRSGARPGDALFVTGALGGSLSGKHLSFEPRMREGAWLAGRATAMIDVSDGLASDLRHLAEASGAGCELETDRIPLSDAARGAGSEAALDRALHDGEDFELLFTAPAAEAARLLADWRAAFPLACSRIGTMTAHAGRIMCRGGDAGPVPLRATAYEHFRHSSGAAGKTARPA
jgi:thiamine-monophosphate kinase